MIGNILSPEQVAYINDRYTNRKIKAGVLLFLDFEKAFDSPNRDFIHECLNKLWFKDDFCRWINIIYTRPKAFVKINGYLSETISIQRGIRQGCPFLDLIFIICTEFMSL